MTSRAHVQFNGGEEDTHYWLVLTMSSSFLCFDWSFERTLLLVGFVNVLDISFVQVFVCDLDPMVCYEKCNSN